MTLSLAYNSGHSHRLPANISHSVPDLPFPLHTTSPGASSIPPTSSFACCAPHCLRCLPGVYMQCLHSLHERSNSSPRGPNWGDSSW